MTVKELIEFLEKLNPDYTVFIDLPDDEGEKELDYDDLGFLLSPELTPSELLYGISFTEAKASEDGISIRQLDLSEVFKDEEPANE